LNINTKFNFTNFFIACIFLCIFLIINIKNIEVIIIIRAYVAAGTTKIIELSSKICVPINAANVHFGLTSV
tara:strand:+ start:300 stop:512 length:213 start_codon:yes stop_codon:yes gene_type:complete